MSIYAKLGGYVGVEPGTTVVYHDRPEGKEWEALAIAKRGQYYDILASAAQVYVRLNKDTRTLEGGRDADGWGGQWNITDDGKTAFIADDVARVDLALEGYRVVKPSDALRVNGIDFVNGDGSRRVLCGIDAFMAFRLFLDGGADTLKPFFAESQALGFDTWRVFMQGSKAQNTVMDLRPTEPGYYAAVRPFADLLNAQGITLLATCFVDNQDVKAGIDHWMRLGSLLRGSVTLLSGGNEWSKNGFDPGKLTDPGLLWSRGSDVGDASPYRPYGSFAEFHPRRDLPASLMDTVASPCFIYGTNKLIGPLIIDEPPKFGTNTDGPFQSPRLAWQFFRHYATECAGVVFHDYFSQRGLLMDAATTECAKAAVKGARIDPR